MLTFGMLSRQTWQSPGGSPWTPGTPKSPLRPSRSTPKALRSPLGLDQAQAKPDSVWAGKDADRLMLAIMNKVCLLWLH